jgi:signal transduction histidine kinase
LLVALGAATALCWRHRVPVIVTAVALVPPLLFPMDSLAALIALAALAANRRGRLMWAGVAAVGVATGVAVWRDAHRAPEASIVQTFFGTHEYVSVPLFAVVLFAAALTAIPAVVGLLRRARREVRQGERQQEVLRSEMARQDERTRIAREMHDVLGHRLSQLSVQAGALEVAQQVGSERAAETARAVRTATRATLDDLRYVVGVLRDGDGLGGDADAPEPVPARPQPTLGDLPRLVASTRESGLTINAALLSGDAVAPPAALGTAAYRIVQESLTNVLRHGSGHTADVGVYGGPGVGLTIEVGNPVDARPGTSGPTNGLTGIGERVAQLGGTVRHGPDGEGRFVVRAWLPWVEPE